MKLPAAAHTDQPWRIHELTRDFRLEDVWSFRTPGAGPDDFPTMLAAMRAAGGPTRRSLPSRFLFAVRRRLGALFGWDRAGGAARTRSLRDRLPSDLRAARGPESAAVPLTPVYEVADECARELVNKTVHAVMHLGWAPNATGEHELRMAVLVRPNGWFGRLYLAAIAPFRHLVVYPALTRQWERAWRDRTVGSAVGTHAVPEAVQSLSSLSHIDYVDLFTLATDAVATPEQWARAMFGDVPTAGERLIWRGLLGLRLSEEKSEDTVAGWRITGRGADWLRLEARSEFLTGNLVARTTDGQVSLATFLRYRRALGRLVWPPLSAVHRGLAPGLLRDAAAKLPERQALVRPLRAGRGLRTGPGSSSGTK